MNRHVFPTIVLAASLVPAYAFSLDCEQVLSHSAGSVQSIADRAADVQHCLSLVDDLQRSAYRNSFSMCENLAQVQEAPPAIELPNGETIPTAGNWTNVIARAGETASTSGCRDGVLSALQRTLFVDTARVRSLFQETGLSLEDVLVGEYDLGMGSLSLESTTLQGWFTAYDGIRAAGNGVVEVRDVPFAFDVVGDASMRTPFGRAGVEIGFGVEGTLDGYLEARSLEVVITNLRPTRVVPGPATALPELVGAVMQEQLTRNSGEIAARASEVLTEALRRAYENANPFSFLSGEL